MFRQQDMAFAEHPRVPPSQLHDRLLDRGHPGDQRLLREARPGVDRAVSVTYSGAAPVGPHPARRPWLGAARHGAWRRRAGAGEPSPPPPSRLGGGPARRAPGARGRGGGDGRACPCWSRRSARSRWRRCRCWRRATPARSSSGSTRTATSTRPPRTLGVPRRDAARGGLRPLGERYRAGLDPARVVLADARDLDPAERAALDRAGVRRMAVAGVAEAVRGERVFLHLDLNMLDPSVMAAAVPAPDGLTLAELAAALRDLAARTMVAWRMTAFDDPEPERLAGPIADAVQSDRARSSWRAARRDDVAAGGENEFRHGHRHGRIRVGRRSGTPGGRARRRRRPAAPAVRLPRGHARRGRDPDAGGAPAALAGLDVEVHLHAGTRRR